MIQKIYNGIYLRAKIIIKKQTKLAVQKEDEGNDRPR